MPRKRGPNGSVALMRRYDELIRRSPKTDQDVVIQLGERRKLLAAWLRLAGRERAAREVLNPAIHVDAHFTCIEGGRIIDK